MAEDKFARVIEMSTLPLALTLACGATAEGHADPARGVVQWFPLLRA